MDYGLNIQVPKGAEDQFLEPLGPKKLGARKAKHLRAGQYG